LEIDGEWSASWPSPLYLQYSLDRRLGGLQSQYGYCGEEKNLSSLPGIEFRFLDHPVDNPSLTK
jgi:hypothetical protein